MIYRQLLGTIRSFDGDYSVGGIELLNDLGSQLLRLTIKLMTFEKTNQELITRLAELTSALHRDQTTGAYSRVFAGEQIKLLESSRSAVAIIFADMDNLKIINDTPGLGHDVGDECLRIVVRLITNAIRGGDMLIRWAGDEFLVIAPGATESSISKIEERICRFFQEFNYQSELMQRICFHLPDWRLSVSFGSDIRPAGDTRYISEMISIADQNMYTAKRCKKGGEPG